MPAPIPSLMRYILDEFKKVNAGGDTNTNGELVTTAEDFAEFGEKLLTKNPPVNAWYPGNGVGVVLADNTRVVLSPTAAINPADPGLPGKMVDSSIGITDGAGFAEKPR